MIQKLKQRIEELTNEELTMLEKIQDDLIIGLFDTRDKRYMVSKALRKAFMLGRYKKDKEHLNEIIKNG